MTGRGSSRGSAGGDVLLILSATILVVTLAAQGMMTIDTAGIWLGVFVVTLALANRLQTSVLRVAVPLASLAFLIIRFGGGDQQASAGLAGLVALLVVPLVGLYFIFGGPRR